jgi:hypothetical protein
MLQRMANEALVQEVKRIVGLARNGNLDEAYEGYRALFSSPDFPKSKPEDQRQALKLMIHMKGAPAKRAPAMIEAHRAAILPLTELVSAQSEPADFEMLGMCHVAVGNEQGAFGVFKAGLAIERERNAQSDLCGALMRRLSEL